jgi:pilus assembly protein Flp/PilA
LRFFAVVGAAWVAAAEILNSDLIPLSPTAASLRISGQCRDWCPRPPLRAELCPQVNLLLSIYRSFCAALITMEATVRALFADLFKDASGVTAIEYALIASLIAVVCITAWTAIGTNLNSVFTSLESSI